MINLLLLSLFIGLAVFLFLKWATKNHGVFEKQGIKCEKPLPLIGNSSHMFTGDHVGRILRIYSKFPDEKVVGGFEFLKSFYFLRSPDVIKQLTVKDFSYFQDHMSLTIDKNDDIFGNILFSMKGKQWRDMRTTLSPMFTGSKMRAMLELIRKCSEQMCEYLKENNGKNGSAVYTMKDLFAKYANDVIATCAFGVEINSLKCPNNDIYKIGQKFIKAQNFSQFIKLVLIRFFPKVARILKLKMIPADITDKFAELITHTMEVRNKENIRRPDMLQLLMKLKEGQMPQAKEMDEIDPENKMIKGEFKRNWTDAELLAQCFLFFLAGFHTTSTVLSFCSYELAVNPELQERLILEIDEAYENLGGNPLSYEIIQKMKYMDMFTSEVLRMWPPVIAADRECRETYTYEDDDGLKFTVQKGDMILVPIYALHMDPKYFPNPHKFDPEHFNDENRPNIDMHTYLPFGVGPRNCIGFRFALMEIKSVIFHLLRDFRFSVCTDTQVPLKLKKTMFGLIPEKEIKLQLIPREDTRCEIHLTPTI